MITARCLWQNCAFNGTLSH